MFSSAIQPEAWQPAARRWALCRARLFRSTWIWRNCPPKRWASRSLAPIKSGNFHLLRRILVIFRRWFKGNRSLFVFFEGDFSKWKVPWEKPQRSYDQNPTIIGALWARNQAFWVNTFFEYVHLTATAVSPNPCRYSSHIGDASRDKFERGSTGFAYSTVVNPEPQLATRPGYGFDQSDLFSGLQMELALDCLRLCIQHCYQETKKISQGSTGILQWASVSLVFCL